jgi:type III restriction enzyme
MNVSAMSTLAHERTVPKGFQQDAINNGVTLLTGTIERLLLLSPNLAGDRAAVVADTGNLLIEAPTGSGKTLVAGHIAERVASAFHQAPVVWFWFAPFAGVVGQTQKVISLEFPGLRLRSLTTDRLPGGSQAGDVYVETWASVSTADEAKRKATRSTESLLGMSEFIADLRQRGFLIGTVVDEAHHTFRGENQAINFYRQVLKPELTVLTTATPDDGDLRDFTATMGIRELRKITVSRQSAVDAGLIKREVKAALYKVDRGLEGLVDFKRTALRQAVQAHRLLKEHMAAVGARMAPLLLVQVDSEDEGDVPRATRWLKELGFREEGEEGLYRVHTAEQPDKDLDTIAADDRIEVLVFKMAVATGFDAPRAAVLVSFRTVRDPDFGVQLVGRILRIDRRLQVIADIPDSLNTGYVFLADRMSQSGLEAAADRMSKLTDELASTQAKVNVFTVGSLPATAQHSMQGHLLSPPQLDGGAALQDDASLSSRDSTTQLTEAGDQPDLLAEMGLVPPALPARHESSTSRSTQPEKHPPSAAGNRYSLRTDLQFPKQLQRVLVSIDGNLVSEVGALFDFDAEAMVAAQRTSLEVIESHVGLFGKAPEAPVAVRASIAQKEIDERAQRCLFAADESGFLDARDLHAALLESFKRAIRRSGLDDAFTTKEAEEAGLARVLALRPMQLRKAVDEAVKRHLRSEDADPLPSFVTSDAALARSRLNIYGIVPADLNNWEREFAQKLDQDTTGTVQWWHRNPVRKPYSVSYPVPGQPDFYPDFVVGVAGRLRKDGILLVETKRVYNDPEGNAQGKSQVEHLDYGRAMMLYLDNKDSPPKWWVITFSREDDANILDRLFRFELMAVH